MTEQHANRSFMIMAVREDGDETGGDYWLPIIDAGRSAPRLSAGEQVLYSGYARVEGMAMAGNKWRTAWTLPSAAWVVITENRLAFVCREFVKGGSARTRGRVTQDAIDPAQFVGSTTVEQRRGSADYPLAR